MDTAYNVMQSRITVKLDDPINLWFFGDIHRDTESCDVERWAWFLKRAKADVDSGQQTLFFGMGDYNDFASFKEQRKMKSGDLHETTLAKLDRMAQSDNAKLASEMQFMKGHILGLIEGNHTWKFHDGKTATEDLAERLQTQSLGWLCHYSLNVDFLNRDTSNTIHFVLCHGKAGGKTFGVTINQVGDLKSVFPAADVYCAGHDHQRGAWPVSVLLPTIGQGGWHIKQKRQFLCRSGSFKKAYTPGTSSYEAGRLLRPADLGALKLVIRFHRDKKNGKDMITTDIEALI